MLHASRRSQMLTIPLPEIAGKLRCDQVTSDVLTIVELRKLQQVQNAG